MLLPILRHALRAFRFSFSVVLLLAFVIETQAQQSTTTITDGRTPSGVAPGSPAGSYPLSGFDNVNLFNGNLNFRLPLLSVGGRGSAGYTMMMALNVKSWHVKHFHKVMPDENEINSYSPKQTGWHPYSGYGVGQLTGRHLGLHISTLFGGQQYYSKTLARLTFSTADGTEYELRDQLSDGAPLNSTSTQGAYRGTVFVTADGTAATYISDTPIYDNPQININGPRFFGTADLSGVLMLRDGTRYRIDGGQVSSITDRNGNKVIFTYSASGMTVTDSLNRQVTVTYNVDEGAPFGVCDKITFAGFGGAQRVIRLSKTNLENALRAGYTIKTLGNAGGLFPELTGGSPSTIYNPTVTSAVWLPDGVRAYKLYYNSHGEIARVELPTGGAYEYDMTPGSGVICPNFCQPDDDRQIYRRVVERRVYPDGSSGSSFERKETYANSETIGSTSSTILVEHVSTNGTVLTRSRHFFEGSALSSMFGGAVTSPYGKWYEGHENQTEQLDTAGAAETATVLRRIVNTRAQRAPVSWWASYASTVGLPQSWEPPKDPRLVNTVTTVEPNGANLVAKRTAINPQDPNSIGFDQYNNPTEVWEYDFGSGTPGVFIRRTHTEYVTTSNYINADVSNPSFGAHLRSLTTQQWVSTDLSGANKASRVIYEYDIYTDDLRHKPLVARPNITGQDAFYTASFTVRGNVTGVTSYANASAQTGPVIVSSQFDVAGNMVATVDGRGNTSSIGFSDSFCNGITCGGSFTANTYAFATTITSAIPDPFGQYASTTAHVTTNIYDFGTGLVSSTTDPNGQVTSFQFNDLLDRLTQVRRGVGTALTNQTTFAYDDQDNIVTTTADLSINNDNVLKSQTVYDGLGRNIENRKYESSSNFIAVKNVPFVVLQEGGTWLEATQTSNPYRPYLGEQPIWTTTFSDSLHRPIKVKSPDSAVLTTAYSGNLVLVTDQNNKQRLSKTNILGQTTDIWEITSADGATVAVSFPNHPEVTAGYQTTYEYDALSNLTKTIQGTQSPRIFVYDSLSRLKSAFNPESGTTNFDYDANGNLTLKTNARGVSVTYAYDALNRSTTVDYSDTTVNPDVTRVYDGAVNGKGRFWYNYAGGNFTAGTNVEHTAIDHYDVLGRPTVHRQLFKLNGTWSNQTYQTTRNYNLAGGVTLQTYPSNRSVTYNYDMAGRLGDKDPQNLAFTGNLGDNNTRTYSAGIVYSSFGSMAKEQFGTDTALYNKLFYNSRGQLSEIRVSTSYTGPTDTTWNRGAIINHYSNNCSGMCGGTNSTTSMTDNNGNLKKQEVYVPNDDQLPTTSWTTWYQQYDYDNLNRLQRVKEFNSSNTQLWQQEYGYDRYGNRTLHQTNTWGPNGGPPTPPPINKKDFAVETGTNRLYAPGDLGLPESQRQMQYDASGNLKKDIYTGAGDRVYDAENRMIKAWGGNNQWQEYTYNADGQRVRRKVDGVETWQIYGMAGELLAEYPANGGTGSPQKEYGYRNGRLLIIAETGTASGAAPSALTAAPSGGGATVSLTWTAASGATNYRVERKPAGGSYVLAGTTSLTAFTDNGVSAGNAYLYKVCAANGSGTCTSSYSNIALGAAISFSDPTIISIVDDPTGATVTPVRRVHITELRTAVNAVRSLAGLSGGTWTNPTLISFVSPICADDVRDLRTQLDQALTALGIQTSAYDDPVLLTGANGTLIKKIHITQLRQRVTSGVGAGGGSGSQFILQWLVTDQLGTPRMILDKTGSLANVKRHDYLPFGEELVSQQGVRTGTQGYSTDAVRQKFTQQERDSETGLDYFGARYFGSTMGRFISADSYMPSAEIANPQTWNRFAYVLNNPLKYVDPLGLMYSDLSLAQRQLFATYAALHNEGGKLTDEQVYNRLSESQMATFEAITHALENTQLTDKKTGQSLGNALSLISRVDEIVGDNIGGKTHLRLYVDLKKDAVGILEKAKQFGGGFFNSLAKDHKRYDASGKVITKFKDNLRLKGDLPSIQISYAEDRVQADIDIDFRSLGEGHTNHYNSDVRQVGPEKDDKGKPINNYQRYIERWPGLRQWWEQTTRTNDSYKGKEKK